MTNTSQDITSSTNKRVVFFGNERLVSGLRKTTAPILQGLIDQGYEVVAIVSHHTESQSRNQRDLEVAKIAESYHIPLFLPHKPSEIVAELHALNPDVAVLVAYGKIVSEAVIDIFPLGIINIHPSLLPRYRGPTPIEAAILNGDRETGVSIMQLSTGMDEGPVYAQKPLLLDGTETKFELYHKMATLSTQLFFETFPSILDGTLRPQPQDPAKASYCKLFTKADSVLIPENYTAQEAERRVRAHLGFPKTKFDFQGKAVVVTRAHMTQEKKTPLDIECRDGAYLSIDELVAPSGKTMSAEAFLRGYAAGA